MVAYSIFRISSVIRQIIFLPKQSQRSRSVLKDGSRSLALFRKGKIGTIAKFHRTDLVIRSHSRGTKAPSYSRINTVGLAIHPYMGMCVTALDSSKGYELKFFNKEQGWASVYFEQILVSESVGRLKGYRYILKRNKSDSFNFSGFLDRVSFPLKTNILYYTEHTLSSYWFLTLLCNYLCEMGYFL